MDENSVNTSLNERIAPAGNYAADVSSSSTTTQMKKLAFVILTWNSGRYIESCLESVLAIEAFDIFALIVDNGSTDDTISVLGRYEQNPKVVVTRLSKNRGTTVSRNIALKAIPDDFDYVCVLDSDTVINADAFITMVKALEIDPSIGIIGPKMAASAGGVQLSGRNLPTLGIKLRKACPIGRVGEVGAAMEIPATPVVDGLQDVPYLLSACWLMPRRILDDVGYLDEAIFYAPEDVDYCVRVHQAGYRVVFCNRASIIHEYQRLSKKKLISKTNVEHIKGLAYYFRKHGYIFDASKIGTV